MAVALGLPLAPSFASENLSPGTLPDSDANWVTTLNYYRSSSSLAPLSESPELSSFVKKHVIYLAMSDPKYFTGQYFSAHSENPASPFYSAQGAASGNVLTSIESGNQSESIDSWMAAPFHAVGLMRENLKQAGWASAFNQKTGVYEIGMNIFGGLTPGRSKIVLFPGDGSSTRMDSFAGENPDPRESCGSSWQSYTGLPIWVSLLEAPAADMSAQLTTPNGESLKSGSQLCLINEFTMKSSDSVYGPAGKAIMKAEHMVIIIPKAPLRAGKQNISLSIAGRSAISWSFSVLPAPPTISWQSSKNKDFITWNEPISSPANPLTGYEVRVGDEDLKNIASYRTDDNSFSTAKLAAGRNFICVRALGKYRNGDCPSYSSLDISATSPSGTVRQPLPSLPPIDINPIGDNATAAKWSLPELAKPSKEESANSLTAMIRKSSFEKPFYSISLPAKARTLEFPVLENGSYQICVSAQSLVGASLCHWQNFNKQALRVQVVNISYPYAENLVIPGSSFTMTLDSALPTTALSLTPQLCQVAAQVAPQISALRIKAHQSGTCVIRLKNMGDELNAAFDAPVKVTIAKENKFKCLKKDQSIQTWSSYSSACPAGSSKVDPAKKLKGNIKK